MKTFEEYNEELRDIANHSKTHIQRFHYLLNKYSESICGFYKWGEFISDDKRVEFYKEVTKQLNYLDELTEVIQDIGQDIDNLGKHGQSFCETILDVLKKS